MTLFKAMAWSVTADLFCSVAADLLILTVHRSDTWWTVILTKAAVVAKMPTQTIIKVVF